jgi:hypothetical protein
MLRGVEILGFLIIFVSNEIFHEENSLEVVECHIGSLVLEGLFLGQKAEVLLRRGKVKNVALQAAPVEVGNDSLVSPPQCSWRISAFIASWLVWSANNKLDSLRQRNCIRRVANRADQDHLCLWYFSRGFDYARNFEGLHAVCALERSFHRGSFVKLSLYPPPCPKMSPPLLATKRDPLPSVPLRR